VNRHENDCRNDHGQNAVNQFNFEDYSEKFTELENGTKKRLFCKLNNNHGTQNIKNDDSDQEKIIIPAMILTPCYECGCDIEIHHNHRIYRCCATKNRQKSKRLLA
jgi:hypothetical protein